MTEKSLWQQLKDVVDCDKKITSLQQDIDLVKRGIQQDHLNSAKNIKLLEEKQHQLFDLQKDVKLKELQITELKEAEDKKNKQLDQVKHQKEYKALESEIGAVSRQRSAMEEVVIKQWYSVDALKKDVDSTKSQLDEKQQILAHDIAIKEENLAHLQEKLTETKKNREHAFQLVQPEWQAQYERMKHSVTDPIVPVMNGSCSSCFYGCLHQDMGKLKKGEVVVCRNCYRFLYFDEQEEKAGATARY